MASPLEVTVTVNTDQLLENAKDICESLTEIVDLVPEWSQIEAEQHHENILELILQTVTSKVEH